MMRRRINRRGFLRRSGLSLVSSGVLVACGESPSPAVQTAEEVVVPKLPSLMLSFQSYSLRHFEQWSAFLAQTESLGLEQVELYRGHLGTDADANQIAEVKSSLSAIGVKVVAFGVETFSSDHNQNEAIFKFAKELGVINLSANPMKDAFESLTKCVEQYDINIAIHNHGPEDEHWRRPEWILDAVRDLDPRIGACVDTGHYLRAGVRPDEAIEMLGERVLGVHLKDFAADGTETIIGEGRLDLDKTFAALAKVGFSGPLSLEYEEDSEDPVPAMLKAVAIVERFRV